MTEKQISHEGIVEDREGGRVRVKITSYAACAGCHARGACSIPEQKDKTLSLPFSGASLNTGDRVMVTLSQSLGFRAIFLGYILPFLLVLAVLLVMTGLSDNELLSGLASLSVLPPYYIAVRLLRNRIDRKFEFTLSLIQP